MESWLGSSWIYLWMVIVVLRSISADPGQTPRYTVNHHGVSFDQAMSQCAPGVLTTLATQPEVSDILRLVSGSFSDLNQKNFTFWVGLRKVKDQCVVLDLRLRGFTWIEDGSQESEEIPWAEEPEETCVTVRCAALKGEFDGTTVTRWGLIPVQCKTKYQYICKLPPRTPEDKESAVTPARPEPLTPEPPEPATPEPPEPATPELPAPASPELPEPASPEPPKPSTPEQFKPATLEPPRPSTAAPHKPESRPGTRKPEPEPAVPPRPDTIANLKPDTGPELQGPGPGSEPVTGKDSCEQTNSPGIRSYIQFSVSSRQIKAECWSSDLVELHCSGHPLVWRLLDDSPANLSAICHPCESGFQKNTLGNCVDIDECSVDAPCKHTCLNTEGSFRCVCMDENGKHHEEDSVACRNMTTKVDDGLLSGILIPVLIAVAAFVVLVVVVAVTVKCYLMRRSKKRAMRKAEKMAMKSKEDKDSFQAANEKAAT
uniref:C-type lectin domain family 14 member A n=1 Tax=Semicossyphus pulcher TaxID=241346 RepID=UPI0037E7A94D